MPTLVSPWEAHGPLRVSANGHYLEHQDGAPFFWLGDTAWHLPRLTPEDVERYLADRAARGFNVIQFYAAQDPSPEYGGQNYAGEIAFRGAGTPFPTVELNDTYWQHIDFIVARARAHGLYLAFSPAWGMNTDLGPRGYFADPDTRNYQYGQLLGTRYREQPHLLWIGACEYQTPHRDVFPMPEAHCTRLARLVEGLRAGDGGAHLVTMHPLSGYSSSDDWHDAPWLALNMIQTRFFTGAINSLVSGDWQRLPAKPTLNAEGWYEGEEALLLRRWRVQRAEPFDAAWVQRFQAYWSVFHGSIGYTYGQRNLWMMLPDDQHHPQDLRRFPGVLVPSALDAPGTAHLPHLRALILSKPLTTRVPDQSLLALNTLGSDATLSPDLRCATRDGNARWAWVYTTLGRPIGVHMTKLAAGRAAASWYNPRSGLWRDGEGGESATPRPFAEDIPSGPGAPRRYFVPPGAPAEGNDWVLALELTA
jgi:hypothetical protein